jgi:DNA-binding transcriptional MerR regulator
MNDPRHGLLTIGGFASATRLSLKALRLYDQLGLLAPRYVDPDSGYRFYHPDQVRAARLIRSMRQMEMPLALIRTALLASPADAERLARDHVRSLESRAEQARRSVDDLVTQLRQEAVMTMDVQVRMVDSQPIISVTERVKVDRLDAHIRDTLQRLYRVLEERGVAPDGPPFGLYHGPINHEEDGPIEVCVPVSHVFEAGGVDSRVLQGGRFASVMLHGEQCVFPAVLRGYDAVYDWIKSNGYEPVDSPREIWHNPPGADERMEIGWVFREPR